MRGHVVYPGVGGWLLESEDEARVAFDVHVSDKESDSLQSNGKRLSQSNDGDEQVDEAQVESQASEFLYGVEHLY